MGYGHNLACKGYVSDCRSNGKYTLELCDGSSALLHSEQSAHSGNDVFLETGTFLSGGGHGHGGSAGGGGHGHGAFVQNVSGGRQGFDSDGGNEAYKNLNVGRSNIGGGGHGHNFNVGGGGHNHNFNTNNNNHSHGAGVNSANQSHSHNTNGNTSQNNSNHNHNTNTTGGGGSHENRPPYYALCFIMQYK